MVKTYSSCVKLCAFLVICTTRGCYMCVEDVENAYLIAILNLMTLYMTGTPLFWSEVGYQIAKKLKKNIIHTDNWV